MSSYEFQLAHELWGSVYGFATSEPLLEFGIVRSPASEPRGASVVCGGACLRWMSWARKNRGWLDEVLEEGTWEEVWAGDGDTYQWEGGGGEGVGGDEEEQGGGDFWQGKGMAGGGGEESV